MCECPRNVVFYRGKPFDFPNNDLRTRGEQAPLVLRDESPKGRQAEVCGPTTCLPTYADAARAVYGQGRPISQG